MFTYTVSGGKWPGIFERLEVQTDGTAVYQVLSGPRVIGTGSGDMIGSFRAPRESRRAELLEHAIRRLAPEPLIKTAPPAAVVHTLVRDGRLVATWLEGSPSPIAGLLRDVVAETQHRPERTLTLSFAAGRSALVFMAVATRPILLDFDNAELRSDLVFENGGHRILDASMTMELLGGARGVMTASEGKPLVLPLVPVVADIERLVQMTLVVYADLGQPWGVSLVTRQKAPE